MEYVIVKCNEPREVFIDQQSNGLTDQSIRVSPGVHTFTLGGENNVTPPSISILVTGTSPVKPLVITFEVQS